MEWTDSSKAAFCTGAIVLFFSVGLMVLSGVAYLIPNWRILQLVLFCPLLLVLGLNYWSAVYLTVTLWQAHQVHVAENITSELLKVTCKSYFLILHLCFDRFLPESARWLVTHDRKEEAKKELQKAARVNRRMVTDDQMDKVSRIKCTLTTKI